MGVKQKVSSAFRWMFGWIKTWGKNHVTQLLDDALDIAKGVVESLARIDLDGDGRIYAIEEVIANAKTAVGTKWASKLLKDGEDAVRGRLAAYDFNDLKRVIATGRIIVSLLRSYAPDLIPRNRVIDSVIAVALEFIDPSDEG